MDPEKYPDAVFPDSRTLQDAKGFLATAAKNRSRPFWIGAEPTLAQSAIPSPVDAQVWAL